MILNPNLRKWSSMKYSHCLKSSTVLKEDKKNTCSCWLEWGSHRNLKMKMWLCWAFSLFKSLSGCRAYFVATSSRVTTTHVVYMIPTSLTLRTFLFLLKVALWYKTLWISFKHHQFPFSYTARLSCCGYIEFIKSMI